MRLKRTSILNKSLLMLNMVLVIIVLFIWINDNISSDSPYLQTYWLFHASSTNKQLSSFFALCCWLFVLHNKWDKIAEKITFKNPNIVHNLLSLFMIMFAIAATVINSANVTHYLLVISITLVSTTGILKQWLSYLHVRDLHYKFTHNVNHTNTNRIIRFMWFIYASYNVIFNYYCVTYIPIQTVFNVVQYFSTLLLLCIFSVPYYILPELRYDLYHDKITLTWFYYCTLVFHVSALLWFYVLQWSVSSTICDILFIATIVFTVGCSFTVSVLAEMNQQRTFITKCAQNKVDTAWSNHIMESRDNYTGFFNFLLDIYCLQDLLFIIDIIQYKNKLKLMLEQHMPQNACHIKYGYRLPFSMSNNILPVSPVVMDLGNITNEMSMNDTVNAVALNIAHFVNKYTLDSHSQRTLLSIKFIDSPSIGQGIRKELNTLTSTIAMNDNDSIRLMSDIVALFDIVLVSTDQTLQLLFRAYQLQ